MSFVEFFFFFFFFVLEASGVMGVSFTQLLPSITGVSKIGVLDVGVLDVGVLGVGVLNVGVSGVGVLGVSGVLLVAGFIPKSANGNGNVDFVGGLVGSDEPLVTGGFFGDLDFGLGSGTKNSGFLGRS